MKKGQYNSLNVVGSCSTCVSKIDRFGRQKISKIIEDLKK